MPASMPILFLKIIDMNYRKTIICPSMTSFTAEGTSECHVAVKTYLPPQIEVVTVAVEQGFSASNNGGMQLPDWDII